MKNDFYAGAKRAILQPSSNFSINLSATPLLTFMARDGGASVTFGAEGSLLCDAGEVDFLKKGIENFNRAGGEYYWLFDNVAINLAVVTGVAVMRERLHVMYPGGTWKSGPVENAGKVYERYLKEGQRVTPGASPEPQQPAAPQAKAKILNL